MRAHWVFIIVVLVAELAGCTADRSGLKADDVLIADAATDPSSDVTIDMSDVSMDVSNDVSSDASSDVTTDAVLDLDTKPDAPACPELLCDGNLLSKCEGGVVSQLDSCMAGCSEDPTPHCRRFRPANVPQEEFLEVEVATDVVVQGSNLPLWDTSNCGAINTPLNTAYQLDEYCILKVRDFVVEDSFGIIGDKPLIVLASRNVIVRAGAVIRADANQRPGPGGGSAVPGEDGGASRGQDGTSDFPGDTGGGGGGGCTAGGSSGSEGNRTGAMGGPAYQGTFGLVGPLTGGSAGGAVFGDPVRNRPEVITSKRGGHGGGALQFSAIGTITIAGQIDVSGGGGQGGTHLRVEGNGGGEDPEAGSGGGAGGSVVLEAVGEVIVTGEIDLRGGGGGGAAHCLHDCGASPENGNGGSDGGGGGTSGTCRSCDRDRQPTEVAGSRGGNGGSSTPGGTSDSVADGGNSGGGGGGGGCWATSSPVDPERAFGVPAAVRMIAIQ